MSLNYIPFQPLYFGELPDDCNVCSEPAATCQDFGVGGTYANLAQYNDVTQFQLALALCDDAVQLAVNPNFEGASSVQLVQDPTFENGLDDYFSNSGSWATGTNQVTLTGNGTLVWAIPTGPFDDILIKLNILAMDGTLVLSSNQGTIATFTSAGIVYGSTDWTPLQLGYTLTFTGASLTLALFEVYNTPQLPEWTVIGSAIVQDGIVQITGTPTSGIVQAGLSPNTTYIVEVNVLELSDQGQAAIQLGFSDQTTAIISETGVQQFIITTAASPYISIIAIDGGSVSVEYIKVYEWFAPADIVVEIIPYGDTTAVATLGADSKYISVDSLTVSIDWDEILVDAVVIEAGVYYIKVTDCDGSITSQPINLRTSHPCTFALRACMDNDALGFDFTAFSPFVRLEASFSQPEYNNPDRLRFIDTRDRATNAYSVIAKIKMFETEYLPEYVLDFLGTLSAYSTLWLGNQQYSVENPSMKPDSSDDFPSWGKAEIELRMVNYPLRAVRCASEVKDCSPPPNCWQWNDESNIDWNDPIECILLNN